MATRSVGAALTRRAPVAWSPSESTFTISSRPITAASALYSAGPSRRAARIVKAYVVTFMIPMATAMAAPSRTAFVVVERRVTPPSLGGGVQGSGQGARPRGRAQVTQEMSGADALETV